MAREEFLRNLLTAARVVSPAEQVNGIRLDPEYLASVLRDTTTWLTPTAVEGFDPADFPELSVEQKKQLEGDVETFRTIAEQVPPYVQADEQQVEAALPAFVSILTTLTPYLDGFRIYHILKRHPFPEYVHDFAVRIGNDSTGDPAVWIWVIIKDEVGGKGFIKRVPEVEQRIETALRRARIKLWPYVHFRTESEQHDLESGLLE
jgi:hypothetical protein